MDVDVGAPIPAWSLGPVSAEKMKVFAAIARDPNPIHWDRKAVAERGLGERLINQGPTNLGYVINMLLAWAGPASIRDLTVRFTANVFDGDHVVAGGVVTAIREEHGQRLADCDVWLDRRDGTRAVAGSATVVLPGSPAPARAG
jgi:acyl dehydratase